MTDESEAYWRLTPIARARRATLHAVIDAIPARFGGNFGQSDVEWTVYPGTNAGCRALIEEAREKHREEQCRGSWPGRAPPQRRREPVHCVIPASEVNAWLATLPEKVEA
ncbi:hypothetical protein KZZ07_26370 [Mameliella sp. CS4]|uniref:hypothetical protein n=1 Tax=Mameliella sp. CS4 TaxID=2862329 RepID=UPI001C5FEA9A|nr:hypothetical protein [Mameliella sp. CS4]MBW4986056.1 hypothetical protein [Mameliella sp. CS4]